MSGFRSPCAQCRGSVGRIAAPGRRSRPFELVRPGNPYDGYTPPNFGAEQFKLAA